MGAGRWTVVVVVVVVGYVYVYGGLERCTAGTAQLYLWNGELGGGERISTPKATPYNKRAPR